MSCKHICYLLIVITLFSACNHTEKNHQTSLKEHWYKRYTGTIAGQPVVVNFYSSGTWAGGTYYYVYKSELLNLSLTNDSANAGHIKVMESVITDRGNNDGDEDTRMTNIWDITIEGDHITGKFHKDKGAPTYDIQLKENYDGAYPFGFVSYSDSVRIKGAKWDATAAADCAVMVPADAMRKDDASFINKILLDFINSDSVKTTSIGDYPKASIKKYLAAFKEEMADMQKDTSISDMISDYQSTVNLLPVYNDHNLLVIGRANFDYSGGAHGNYGTEYLNIDMKEQKKLNLTDVMKDDSVALSNMLNTEARSKFNLHAGASLEESLLVESIPATNNFIISDKGITFCYNPYEIASFADGEVKLFIPYNKLKPLLNAAFVARMGVKI